MPDLHTLRHRGLVAARTLLVVSLAVSTACVPKVQEQIGLRDLKIEMPDTYGDDEAAENDLEALRAEQIFEDPHLVALIEEALTHSQELEILKQEMNVANAAILARRGQVFPKVGLGIDAGVEKVGRYTSQGASDVNTPMEPGLDEVPEHLGDFRIALQASWEIDIWKKLRNATKAAKTRFLESSEGRTFAITGVIAEISNSYYELVGLDRQLEVLDANIELLEQALEVVKLQQQAARVTSLGVQRFEAELLKNQSRRYDLLQQRVETENRLNALVGRYPQPVERTTSDFVERPLRDMTAGLPAQLLTRRPDLRAAELELEATKLDVKVARAEFFPSLAIDATFGIEAFNPAKFAALPASLLYNVAANLFAPLFNRPKLKSEWYAANAEQMKAVVTYEQTALLAFVDVANQLAAIENMDHRFERKAQQVERLETAIETSNQLFRSARADYLEVLTTRREALEAELELVETRQRQMAARIDLYRALGGGWPETTNRDGDAVAINDVEGGR